MKINVGQWIVGILWVSAIFNAEAQNRNESNVPQIDQLVKVPASPEAQAFIKYGNTPVNLYTGTPDINIPLANLKGREIEIPIALTYDASGVKVEQIATWVGLGWNLNVGGSVNRQVIGKPDDYTNASPDYFPFYSQEIKNDYEFVRGFSPANAQLYPHGQLTSYFDMMSNVLSNGYSYKRVEIEPDTYSFHVLGLSGTFVIDYITNTAKCIENPAIKATPIIENIGLVPIKVIKGWVIQDEIGNTFHFMKTEVTMITSDGADFAYTYSYYSTWQLTKIESTNKKDVVDFSYGTDRAWEQPQLAGRGDVRNDYLTSATGIDVTFTAAYVYYKITQSELEQIKINGKLAATFGVDPTITRKDLKGRKSLENVTVFNQNNEQVKNFKFNYSYNGNVSSGNDKTCRLMLDRIDCYGKNNAVTPLSYQFQYNAGTLPSRDSYSTDFWGYYNGASNSTLIPYNYELDEVNRTTNSFVGADRKPNFSKTLIGTLSKIIYPTGGSTELTYGLNKSKDPISSLNYTEGYHAGELSLMGGTLPLPALDPFKFYACAPDRTGPPKGIAGSFSITQGGRFTLRVIATGPSNTSPPGGHLEFFSLYRLTAHGASPVFCDLYNNNVGDHVIQYKQHYGMSPGFNQVTEFNLVPGTYRMMIVNNRSDLTITATVEGERIIYTEDHNVGGLRILKVVDKNEKNTIANTKCYYYDDLNEISGAITESSVLSSSAPSSGSLHQTLYFEDGFLAQKYDANQSLITTEFYQRFSENRIKAPVLIGYPKVTEVQFSPTGFLGYTVNEFYDIPDNYIWGFAKSQTLNGRLIKKRVYTSNKFLLQEEENFYTRRYLGGTSSFTFSSNRSTRKDLYIKSYISNPSEELFEYEDPSFNNIHDPNAPSGPMFESHCSAGNPYNNVIYNIIKCYGGDAGMGAQYQKNNYYYDWFWSTLDSVRTKRFETSGVLKSVTKNYYDNPDHYQITRTESKDSRGSLKLSTVSYPHEMKSVFPSDPIWTSLINQNRIAEPIQRKTFQNSTTHPLISENTIYKTVGTMVLPDIRQYASGNNPFEDRIQFHKYDSYGNVTELSRVKDMRMSLLYGYNNSMTTAEVKNATANEIFYTSFEYGEEGGNSALNDARTGRSSRMDGYTKVLNNLTASTGYVLTYWQKSGNFWSLQTQLISLNSVTTSYTISLSGQVDEVRLYPQRAQMTTFAYDPGIGLTSVTDPNNFSTFYGYDDFGRLIVIKDDKSNILKTFEYKINQGQ